MGTIAFRLVGFSVVLCGLALGGAYGAEAPALDRAKAILAILDAAESGSDVGLSPRAISERLAQAAIGIAAYLRRYPEDVDALIVSARLDRFSLMGEPTFLKPGEQVPDPAAAYRPAHQKLDRALALQPNNAEARYWKARLHGLRHLNSRDGILGYAVSDLDQSIRYSREAVALAPANDAYREALALYLVAAERPAEAVDVMGPADVNHPMKSLLDDLAAVPIPASAISSPVDGESLARMMMGSGQIRDYPQLRSRFFIVPMSLAELEEFYSRRWPGFKFLSEGGTLRQHFTRRGDAWQPAGTNSRLPEHPRSGIALMVIAPSDEVKERRKTPSEVQIPASAGDGFRFLVLVNFRPRGP